MKLRYLIFFSLLAACFGQNVRYDSVASGPHGPIPGALVAVCAQPANTSITPCTPLANLCSSLTDLGCSSPNPVTSDPLGNFHFYVRQTVPPVTVQIYGPSVAVPYVLTDQALGGASSGGGGGIGQLTGDVVTTGSSAAVVGMHFGTSSLTLSNTVPAPGTCLQPSGTTIVGGTCGIPFPPVGIPQSTGTNWTTSFQTGTAAGDLPVLDSSARLPPVDASQLINMTVAQIAGAAPSASPSFTGTVTLPDASTATTSGINVANSLNGTGSNPMLVSSKDQPNTPTGTPSAGFTTFYTKGGTLCALSPGASETCTGQGGGGSSVFVNSAAVTNPNFNGTAPTADPGFQAATFKANAANVIVEFPLFNVGGTGVVTPNLNAVSPAAQSNFVNATPQVVGSNVSLEVPLPPLNNVLSPTANTAWSMGTNSLTETIGDYGAAPLTGVHVITDSATTTTDTSNNLRVDTGASSSHNPLFIAANGVTQFQVCHQPGPQGQTVVGSAVTCPNIGQSPFAKFVAMSNTNGHTVARLFNGGAGNTGTILELSTATASGSGFNFWTACTGATGASTICPGGGIVASLRGDGFLTAGGASFGGKVTTVASAAGGAGFNLPPGAAPTTPVNGDLWSTASGVFAQVNGATVGPFGVGGGGGIPFPSTPGIAVCSGTPCTAWITSLTAPTGTVVGTSDTQALTNKTLNGLTVTTTTGTFTLANARTLTVNNSLTFAGTDSTTMTFPTTSATIARTDAANTFTGHQTIEGVTSTGATGTGNFVFATSPILTTPSVTTINDGNGNPFIASSATTSAVDSVTITNAATANPATVAVSATGSDANINLQVLSKGTGSVQLPAGALSTPSLQWSGFAANSGLYAPTTSSLCTAIGGTCEADITSSGIVLADGGKLAWSQTGQGNGTSAIALGLNGSTGTTEYIAVKNGTTLIKSGNTCIITADVTLSTSATTICTWTLPNVADTWALADCTLLWSVTAGTTPTLAFGVNPAQTPAATTNFFGEIWTTNPSNAAPTVTASSAAVSASGNTTVVTSPTLTTATTIFQAKMSGTLSAPATSGTFLLTATGTGTSFAGVVRAGSTCSLR